MDVLISGAGVAGLSAAHWFARAGARVTVCERAGGVRTGGAPVDVRGEALGVAARMGILDGIDQQRVPPAVEAGRVLDDRGAHVANIDLTWFANETDNDIEITRDRLNSLLLGVVPPEVEFRYGTWIEAIDDGDRTAAVTFSDGTAAAYDLVVGADGLHSATRGLVFGPERGYLRHLGCYVALLNLDPARDWNLGMLTVPGLSVIARDPGDGPLAYVMARSPAFEWDYRDAGEQRQIVAGFLSELGAWEVPAIRAAFLDPASTGFYFDSVSQIHMPGWTRGHVALLGDAAYCAALLSGMGTSIAMIGAEILATEWAAAGGDLAAAAPGFTRRLRPHIDMAQASVEHGGGIMIPATQEDVDQRNQLLRDLEAKIVPTIYLSAATRDAPPES
jgi:2-polyprenyl-6-methoxyphenol hydroxylase-like FAD-dependent oxidoreductase